MTSGSGTAPAHHPGSVRGWLADHVPHFRPATAKPHRWYRRRGFIVAMIVAVLAYPVLGTLFLWTGLFERALRSDSLIVRLEHPSWTLWPGHIHVHGATVLANGETQFKLQAKNLLLHVSLLRLIKRHLKVTELSGDDIHLFVRVKVNDPRGMEARLAAYPPLPDLPGRTDVVEPRHAAPDQPSTNFTVELEGLDAHIAELWVMEYHYVGAMTLRGGFLSGPLRMFVDGSAELGPGELRFGAKDVVASSVGGKATVKVPDMNPMQHADASFLELLTADASVKADVKSLAHVAAYAPGTRVDGGEGPFEARILLSNGGISAPSYATFKTKELGIRRKGFVADTDWTFDARFGTAERREGKGLPSDGEVLPRLASKSALTRLSLGTGRTTFKLQLRNQDHEVVLDSNQLGRMTDIDHAQIRFPTIVTDDVRDVGALAGKPPTSFESQAGDAYGSVVLDIDRHHVMTGTSKAAFRGLKVLADDMLIQGQGVASCHIRADLDHKTSSLTHAAFEVTDVATQVGDQQTQGWWLAVEAPEINARGFPPEHVNGRVSLRAKSAEPLLKFLAAKRKIPGLVPDLTSLNDLRAAGTFRESEALTDVELEPLKNVLFNLAGRYYEKGKDQRYAFVVGGKVFSLGIANEGSGLEAQLFAREGWLNEKLARFPKPVTQVHSSEP